MADNTTHHITRLLILVLCILSVAFFAWRNHRHFYQTPIDFLIFVHAGETFEATGELYQRSDDYKSSYHPSAAIFKFPPAYQFMVMPFTAIDAEYRHLCTRLLFTLFYLLSFFLLYRYCSEDAKLDRTGRFYLATSLIIVGCWFMPFFESIRWLLTEIPFLLVFTGSFLLLTRASKVAHASAGALLAYTATAKIYPAFMLAYLIARWRKTTIIAAIAGGTASILAGLYVFGWDENLFYLKTILPVLLNEEVTDKWVNLNAEKFLYIIGVIPDITGAFFHTLRGITVTSMFFLLYYHRHKIENCQGLVFAFIITTMFFCFPNYWPQYQIFLIIPIAFLFADCIRSKNAVLFTGISLIVCTLFIPDLLWQITLDWDVERKNLDMEVLGKEAWRDGTGSVLLKYSPVTWLLYFGYEWRAAVPIVFWIILARKLHRS